MKRIALITMAVLLFAACRKEEPIPTPQPEPDTTPAVTLAGTSWVGNHDDHYYSYPATLTWRLDFLTDSTCTLHFEGVIAAQPQPSFDDTLTYTLDGTEGTAYNANRSYNFSYDSTQHTITWELEISDGSTTLGGITILYPEGENHDAFPVNTSWEAEQQLTVSDTLMTVHWGLDFWEYGWGGQVNYHAGSICTAHSLLWQYDSTAHSGHIKINDSTYPFTYNPATEILTLEYSTTVHGTDLAIGGALQYHRASETRDKKERRSSRMDNCVKGLKPNNVALLTLKAD